MKKATLILTLFTFITGLLAQTDSTFTLNKKSVQASFWHPLGTSGDNSVNNSYDFSLNVITGYTGAVEILEVGYFLNLNKYYANGTQLAGFLNITGEKDGDAYTSKLFQVAGFGNINYNHIHGGQVAGFINQNKSINGIQLGGFINLTENLKDGYQIAGFTNIASEGHSKTQIAGFLNTVPKAENAQIAGFLNKATTISKCAQIAGFANLTEKVDSSIQVAGFANIAPKGESNLQAAGFINIADKVKGMQVSGCINICDSIDGIPIGLVSIARKNGYRAFEVSVSDFALAQASFKLGVKEFYNIYTLSKLPDYGSRWSFGTGVGHAGVLSPKLTYNLEATIHQELWLGDDRAPFLLHTERSNLLNQLKFAVATPIGTMGHYYIAPTINIAVAKQQRSSLGDDIGPHWGSTFLSGQNGQHSVSAWVGFSTGFTF